MLEPEVAFADLDDDAQLAEQTVKALCSAVLERCEADVHFFHQRIDPTLVQRLTKTVQAPFVRMPYSEAIGVLQRSGATFEFPVKWEDGLSSEHERWLSEKHCDGVPVLVTHYPAHLKPFYMRQSPKDDPQGPVVECMDMLVPRIGELIGGSAREHDFTVLRDRMLRLGLVQMDKLPAHMKPGFDEAAQTQHGRGALGAMGGYDASALGKDLSWYLELRRFGTVPHAGFGLGLERFIMYATGLDNIRDVIPVPRYPGYCRF